MAGTGRTMRAVSKPNHFPLSFMIPSLRARRVLAAVPPTLLAVVQFGFGRAAVVLIGYVVINNVLGNIIEPRFMGQGLGLSTLAVFLSLLFWGWLLGPVGMLLSIPLASTLKSLGGEFLMPEIKRLARGPEADDPPVEQDTT